MQSILQDHMSYLLSSHQLPKLTHINSTKATFEIEVEQLLLKNYNTKVFGKY